MGRTHGKTNKEVLKEVKLVFGDSLLYDKFEYVNCKTKVMVGCAIHHNYYFEKWPNDLKAGYGCSKCSGTYRKTHSDFIDEVAKKYPHLKVKGRYKNAKTKIDFHCKDHNFSFNTNPNQLLTGHVNCPECIAKKSIQSKLKESKSVADPATKTEFELYKRAVWRYSNRAYKRYMSEQIRDRHNHLDHVLSILDGFNNNLDPEIVGSIHNLRIITGIANRKKSYKSDITAKQLLERYNNA
jgi:hypothetical protein